VILHYTVSDLPRSIKTLTTADVSAHYLLTDTEQPFFYTLVDESRQSNHAGISSWKIYNQLNSASIGIEIVNPGFKETAEGRVYAPFQQAQIDQLIVLLKDIVKRHNIAPGISSGITISRRSASRIRGRCSRGSSWRMRA
jgi:N-acetylmuramoyl-L-alanine amidase